MTVIAERVLTLLGSDGSKSSIPARVFAPEMKDGAWFCAVEIGWPRGAKRMEAGGVDSVQALLIGMQIIGTWLYTSEEHKRGQLYFERPDSGYGFPVPRGLRDCLVGDDLQE
jgi:hypothetical protein